MRFNCEVDRYGRMWIKDLTAARRFQELIKEKKALDVILGTTPEPPPPNPRPPTNPDRCPNTMCPEKVLIAIRPPFEDSPTIEPPTPGGG